MVSDEIRRPQPWPRQGRRLGPPQVWNFSFLAPQAQSSLSFSRRSQPTGNPRPHQWLLMGVQACRLPAPKRLKRLKRLKPLKLAKAFRNAQPRRHKLSQGQIHRFFWTVQELPQGQIHRFFWAVQPAVRQAFAANRHPKATSIPSYGRPSRPFASP